MSDAGFPIEGGCACREVRYRVMTKPLFVHCCHCRWCQRETGSAFVLNAMIESDRVTTLQGKPQAVLTPSESGKGQTIVRCPTCRVALWSHYAGAGEKVKFMRVGAFDNPELLPPDIHIYASTKQPWVALTDGKPVFPEFYDPKQVWPKESLERFQALRAKN